MTRHVRRTIPVISFPSPLVYANLEHEQKGCSDEFCVHPVASSARCVQESSSAEACGTSIPEDLKCHKELFLQTPQTSDHGYHLACASKMKLGERTLRSSEMCDMGCDECRLAYSELANNCNHRRLDDEVDVDKNSGSVPKYVSTTTASNKKNQLPRLCGRHSTKHLLNLGR